MANTKNIKRNLSVEQIGKLLKILKGRFEKNMIRHKRFAWDSIEKKLMANPEKLWSLNAMEETGGEPDVVEHDKKTGQFVFFYDCSEESPKERRSLCYDDEALA